MAVKLMNSLTSNSRPNTDTDCQNHAKALLNAESLKLATGIERRRFLGGVIELLEEDDRRSSTISL